MPSFNAERTVDIDHLVTASVQQPLATGSALAFDRHIPVAINSLEDRMQIPSWTSSIIAIITTKKESNLLPA